MPRIKIELDDEYPYDDYKRVAYIESTLRGYVVHRTHDKPEYGGVEARPVDSLAQATSIAINYILTDQ